jgi:hypothetical protein
LEYWLWLRTPASFLIWPNKLCPKKNCSVTEAPDCGFGLMARRFAVGDCVQLPDGRTGRVRRIDGRLVRVRVRRRTSSTHQFLILKAGQLKVVTCPQGWMTPGGYRRYLKQTLAKMRQRLQMRRNSTAQSGKHLQK